MKKTILFCMLAGLGTFATAQHMHRQNKNLYEELNRVTQKVDKFNLYLNAQGNFDMDFDDGLENGSFKMSQLRIEAKGNLNNWLSYRYRQRLNRSNDGSSMIDNLPNSIDYAGIGINLDKWSFFLGKQCASYGGFEFDLNPIEIYQYSDMIDNMSNFMTGVDIAYNFTPDQQLQFQVLNSLNGSTEDTYGVSPRITPAKAPLVYTLNWNGNFDDVIKTRWSASAMNETKDNWMYYFAIGNQLTTGNFNMFVDVMYSIEDIDRKGIITSMLPGAVLGGEENHNAFDARYLSVVTKLNYRFLPKWNVFAKGMYETASINKDSENIVSGQYRTSWGYLGGVEYYPMESNLHFFLTYIGRAYNYTDKAKALGWENSNKNRITLGFIYQLPVF